MLYRGGEVLREQIGFLSLRPMEVVNSNTIQTSDFPIHSWYRFVLSFPPHLVRKYLDTFHVTAGDLVFDPFCGTGTTLVEAKKCGFASCGCDAHPFTQLVSRVKTNWTLDLQTARELFGSIADEAEKESNNHGLYPETLDSRLREHTEIYGNGYRLPEEIEVLLPEGFVSERPLLRLLILKSVIEKRTRGAAGALRDFFYLALAHTIANGAGNFAFGPEIYRTKAKSDYDVLGHFCRVATTMMDELQMVQEAGLAAIPSEVIASDARELKGVPKGITTVITSPPYPNEKDYTRSTRVESLLLGLISDKKHLREIKENLLRSNTRNVFVKDRDMEEVKEFPSIQKACREIEDRRIELGKTSGFERLYHKVVAHYFGGMRRHFRSLYPRLERGAKLAYVVGDQLSFLMVHIPTARFLGELAEAEGYKFLGCDLWRERVGTKVKNDVAGRRVIRVREEVLVLQKGK
ncbi:MAG TPA: DNA methyltransferase [Candidatus Methylacidiphilales bacterium]|jgi:DNA modification methylase|nr:DNA methyltransferase [Candidatus Methylacidiphilales bacterium]